MAGLPSPQPGTGRPQYVSLAKERRLVTAICSRQRTSRSQARHTDSRAASSSSEVAPSASGRTAAASRATGVAASPDRRASRCQAERTRQARPGCPG